MKIANRCQAGALSPAGTGTSQMPIASAKGKARLSQQGRAVMASVLLCRARPAARRPAPGP